MLAPTTPVQFPALQHISCRANADRRSRLIVITRRPSLHVRNSSNQTHSGTYPGRATLAIWTVHGSSPLRSKDSEVECSIQRHQILWAYALSPSPTFPNPKQPRNPLSPVGPGIVAGGPRCSPPAGSRTRTSGWRRFFPGTVRSGGILFRA